MWGGHLEPHSGSPQGQSGLGNLAMLPWQYGIGDLTIGDLKTTQINTS